MLNTGRERVESAKAEITFCRLLDYLFFLFGFEMSQQCTVNNAVKGVCIKAIRVRKLIYGSNDFKF